MADKTQATSDQPRVPAKSLGRDTPSVQYRVTGIKSATKRSTPRKASRQ